MQRVTFFVIGQSNAANFGIAPRISVDGETGKTIHRKTTFPLSDPVPGGGGNGASVWPRLAVRLKSVAPGSGFDFCLAADGGLTISDLCSPNHFFPTINKQASDLVSMGAPPDFILLHQGERDTLLHTQRDAYASSCKTLISQIREIFKAPVPVILARASYRENQTSEEVRAAQLSLVDPEDAIFEGPDTDILGRPYRADGTHFNEAGLDGSADSWAHKIVGAADALGFSIR